MKRTGRKNSTIICLLGMSMLLSLGVCVLMVPIEGKASSRDVRVSVVESETEQQKRESSQDVQIQGLENEKDPEKKETGNYGTVREENARTVFFWNLAIFGVLPLTLIFVPELIAQKMARHREEKNLWKYPQPGVYTLYECKKVAGFSESIGRGTGKKSALRQINSGKFSKG